MDGNGRYPPGHPPHEPVNAMRVGAFAGGAVAVALVWIFDLGQFWLVIVGAAVGAAIGYSVARSRSRS